MDYEQGLPFMVNQNANPPLSSWGQRITQLEAALEASGRRELAVSAMAPVRQLFDHLTRSPDGPPPDAVDLLGRAFAELKACIVDPGRAPDPGLLQRLQERAAEVVPGGAPTVNGSGPSGTNGHAGPGFSSATPGFASVAEGDAAAADSPTSEAAPLDGDAFALLQGFASGDDDELSALLDTVDARDASGQSERLKDELGTLRENEDSHEGRVFMKGELQPGLLSDLIQLFAQNRETGRLLIESTQGKASLFLAEGQIVDAECGGEVGEKGFYNLMQIREGRFSYQRGIQSQNVRIYRKTQHLIMDTLRLIDESA